MIVLLLTHSSSFSLERTAEQIVLTIRSADLVRCVYVSLCIGPCDFAWIVSAISFQTSKSPGIR